MVENYILSKKLVSSKYGNNCDNYEILVLGLYTLLCKYESYKDLVINVFNKTSIFIEDGSLSYIVKKHNIEMIDFDEEEEEIKNSASESCGISSNGEAFDIGINGDVVVNNCDPFIICSLKSKCNEYILNIFVHEMNHLIKSQINSSEVDINDSDCIEYHVRSGINFYHYKYIRSEDCLYQIDYFSIIDEVINTIQTTEMMENILLLDGIIPDADIQSFIKKLNPCILLDDYGYDLCVKIFRHLWANKKFRELVEENIVQGDIDTIVSEFDNVLGEGSFEEMADLLDDLDKYDACGKKGRIFEKKKSKLRKIINNYNKSTNFVYKK